MKRLFSLLGISKSFKREVLAGMLVASLIPSIIITSLLVNIFRSRLERDYEEEAARQISEVTQTLADYFERIDAVSLEIITDSKITDSIYVEDSWEKNKAYTRLYQVTDDIRNYAGFNIYNKEGTRVFSTEAGMETEYMPVYWGILKVAFTHPDDIIIKRAVLPDSGDVILQTARAIFKDEDCIGFVVTDITAQDIEAVLYKTYDESNGITIVDSFYEEIYSTRTGVEHNMADIARKQMFEGASYHESEGEVEFFKESISDTGLTLILGKEPVLTEDITRTMWYVTISISGLSLIFCLIVATVVSSYLSSPVKDMADAMDKVRGGNLDTAINSKRKDELGRLSNQFDNMTGELKNYMELKVKHQQELNDSNIAMMQAQLNPHFLYNTLDTIKWVAKINQVPDVAKMSADLATILRMSISDTKFVTLREEMDLVDKYVEIQKIRFGGNFTYDVELPMELEDCKVPKLIVQPIVENALIHGLKEQEHGHIFSNVYEENGSLVIEVSDNGCGIEDDVIARINTHNRENFRGHIGFFNVDTIIKLYYGEQYGIKAARLDEGGTMITITLPIDKQGGRNA